MMRMSGESEALVETRPSPIAALLHGRVGDFVIIAGLNFV
jgi:hypothetical protein